MRISIWYFLRPQPGLLQAISARAAERFFSGQGGELKPDPSGFVRYAQLFVETENRSPIGLLRIDFLQCRAHEDGTLDREHMAEIMSAVPSVMSGLRPAKAPRGVIDAEHLFAKRRMDHLSRWKPTQKDLLDLRRVVNSKAGRDIM
jgi:hypothetical protein